MLNLTQSIGHEVAENAICEIISRFESAFPSRIVSYYIEGSYADGTAIPTSDLDLVIVFKNAFAEWEEATATGLVETLESDSLIDLDIELIDEVTLRQNASPMFKLGSLLIYGEEIRDSIPLMPINEWARERMHAAYWLTIKVFERPTPVHYPLNFPMADAPYFGYVNRPIRFADGREVMTTRNLIRVTGWIATARIAHEANEYVVRKRECHSTYQQTIGDEWTSLLGLIDQRCRTDWHYRIPDSNEERQELRAILEQTLAYENHFLGLYRRFVLSELASPDSAAKMAALHVLKQVPYDDADVLQAVGELTTAQEPGIHSVAKEIYTTFQKESTP